MASTSVPQRLEERRWSPKLPRGLATAGPLPREGQETRRFATTEQAGAPGAYRPAQPIGGGYHLPFHRKRSRQIAQTLEGQVVLARDGGRRETKGPLELRLALADHLLSAGGSAVDGRIQERHPPLRSQEGRA